MKLADDASGAVSKRSAMTLFSDSSSHYSHRVHGQQWRMRESLVQILHHHFRLIENQVSVYQCWHRIIGVKVTKLGSGDTIYTLNKVDRNSLLG